MSLDEHVHCGDLASVVRASDADRHRVSVAEPILEMLGAAETLEVSVDHDGEPRAQHLALLHAM